MAKKIRRQPSLEKARDKALWLNFKHRVSKETFGVVYSAMGDYFIFPIGHPSFEESEFEVLANDYADMTYKHIKHIGMDENPLGHWEEIRGMFSIMNGEILRYILSHKVPLEKFIRTELANRGYDENHLWVGFDKSDEIWLK